MKSIQNILRSIPVVVGFALTGCAADQAAEDTANATGAATATTPITIENFASHPTIKGIDEQVKRIDALPLTKATNKGCDGSKVKFTDASGKIRKLVAGAIEGASETRTTVYYNEAGVAFFAFAKEADFSGGKTEGDIKRPLVREIRGYFAPTGRFLFQTIREEIAENLDSEVTTDLRLPSEDESWADGEGSSFPNPEAWFQRSGC